MKMMISIPFTFMYHSTTYLIQNFIVIVIVILLDIFPVITTSIKCSIFLNNYYLYGFNVSSHNYQIITKFYSNISLLPLFKYVISCQSSPGSTTNYCLFSYIFLIVITLILFLLIISVIVLSHYFHFDEVTSDKEAQSCVKSMKKSLLIFYVNFFDYIFFRLGSFFILFIIINFIVNSILRQLQFVYLVFGLLLLCFYVKVLCNHFYTCFVYIKIGINYPFDYFTRTYDLFLLLIKVIYSFEINLDMQKSDAISYSYISLFLGFMGVACNVLFIIYVALKLVFSDDMIFYTNYLSNSIRIFLIIYQSLCIIGFSVVQIEASIVLHSASHIAFLLFSLFLTKSFQYYYHDKIVSRKEINQLLYLIENYNFLFMVNQSNPPKSFNIAKFCQKLMLTHWSRCPIDSEDCSLCSTYEYNKRESKDNKNTHDSSILNFFDGLYLYTKTKLYNEKNSWKYQCVKFIYHIYRTNKNYYKLSLVIQKTNRRLRTADKALSINLLLYYKLSINKMNQIAVKINSLHLIEEQSKQINEMVLEVENALFTQVFNPGNIVASALKVHSLNRQINVNVMRHENKNQYQTIIIKFILEKLFCKKVHNCESFDITFLEELIQEHYNNDCHLIMSHDLNTKVINIISSGHHLIKYKSKRFEDLFYWDNESFVRSHFNESLNNHFGSIEDNHFFQFPIKDLDHSEYIDSFKLRYLVLPTFNLEDCFLFGIYQIQRESSIMTILNTTTQEELITRYSYDLKKDLLIPLELVDELSMNKISINLKNVFSLKGTKSELFEINYQEYCPFVKRILIKLLSFKGGNITQNLEAFKSINSLLDKCSTMKASFKDLKLKKKIESAIPDEDKIIKVYYFEKENDGKGIHIHEMLKIEDENNIHITNMLRFNESMTYGAPNAGTSLSKNTSNGMDRSASSSIHSGGKTNLILKNIKLQEDANEKKKQTHKFRMFTYLILVFNVFLIVFTIIFLVIQTDKSSKFNQMFQFYILWSRIIRRFFHSALNIFFSICTALPDVDFCHNTFIDYERKFAIQNKLPIDFSIQKYVFNELIVQTDGFKDYINQINSEIYALNEKKILEIIESTFYFRYLSIVGKTANIKEEHYTFINALTIYVGTINTLCKNNDYATKPIYLLEIHGSKIEDISLKHIRLDQPITEGQIGGYNIILNFPIYLDTFFLLNDVIFGLLSDKLNQCKSVVLSFTLILISLHLVLFAVCLWFSSFFQLALDNNLKIIKTTIENNSLKHDLSYKLTELKKLALFYEEDPNKLINSFTIKENEIKRRISLINKKDSNSYHRKYDDNFNKLQLIKGKRLFQSKKYIEIFKPSLIVLSSLAGIYSFYSIVFISLLLLSLENFHLIITVVNNNTNLDTSLSTITALLQVILMTNQTEVELGQYLTKSSMKQEDKSFNIMDALFTRSFESLFTVETLERKDLIPVKSDYDCATLYTLLNDSIIYETNQRYSSYGYLEIIPVICSSFKFTDLSNTYIIIHEVIFQVEKLIKTLRHTYIDLYNTNSSYALFSYYLIMLFLIRPIRSYQSVTLFIEIINEVIISNTWITYFYLCLNIVIEMCLFVMIRTYIIKKYNLINKSMNTLSRCIKII